MAHSVRSSANTKRLKDAGGQRDSVGGFVAGRSDADRVVPEGGVSIVVGQNQIIAQDTPPVVDVPLLVGVGHIAGLITAEGDGVFGVDDRVDVQCEDIVISRTSLVIRAPTR